MDINTSYKIIMKIKLMPHKGIEIEGNIVELGADINGVIRNYDVCCGREKTPSDIEELIRESKNDGVYEEMQEEINRDIENSKYFGTICVGIQGYYKNIVD